VQTRRQETVKILHIALNWANPGCRSRRERPRKRALRTGDEMSIVVFILLTVAIFAVLGVVQKLVEGL
jgi:hypothetical protein